MRLSAFIFFFCVGTGWAQDRLIPGPGSTLTENKCKICHELQHIRRSPLSRGEWADNLRNMKERGTPMTDAEMQVILDYLSTYYNREKPAPAPSADTLAAGGDSVQGLLERNGCIGCHALDQKVVGPAFRDVARRYASDTSGAAQLATKIREGTQGTWGPVPMPPNPSVSPADAQALASWVLQQK
ncbi:MAG TPA: c-type cytochrome [Burkholderiales bacterium]|nr:c-type cytochrome [Burkholderiales bacterium]